MIKTIKRYTNEEGFTYTFEAIEDSIKIKKTKEGYEVKYITYDSDVENPFENQDGMGNFYHWDNREELHKYCDLLGFDMETKEKITEQDKYAVKIDKYEHSCVYYSISGEGRQCRWDTSSVWAVWYPDNCLIEELDGIKSKDKRQKRLIELARQACELHNQWANGEVYCIVKENYDKNKEQIDYDVCGGYFGSEYALKALETDI